MNDLISQVFRALGPEEKRQVVEVDTCRREDKRSSRSETTETALSRYSRGIGRWMFQVA